MTIFVLFTPSVFFNIFNYFSMQIKVFGKNKELFDIHLKRVLDLACIACMGGYIPTEYEISNPERSGLYWFKEEKRIHLFGRANDHWAHIRSQGDVFAVLEFTYRYDKAETLFATALCNLVAARFPDNVKIIDL